MSAPVTWVVGAGGLLGQHVRAASQGWVPPVPVPWHDPAAANDALRQGVSALLEHADARPWNIAWCAGAGVVATSQEHLDEERLVFSRFLDDLADRAGASPRGAVFLASSAGESRRSFRVSPSNCCRPSISLRSAPSPSEMVSIK